MQEEITKAVQGMDLVTSDLKAALAKAIAVKRPEGQTVGDKATVAYLIYLLRESRNLLSALMEVS